MGIFYKDCPHCAATHAAATSLCGCGYVFSGEKLDEPDLAPELAAQEEKLYEAYLAARLEQAILESRDAQRMADVDPQHAQKAQIAADKAAALNAAQADFDAQAKKTAEAVRMAEIVKAARAARYKSTAKTKVVSQPATLPSHHSPSRQPEKVEKRAVVQAKPDKQKKPSLADQRKQQAKQAEAAKRLAEQARHQAEQAKLKRQAEQAEDARRRAKQAEQARLQAQQVEAVTQARRHADAVLASRAHQASQAAKAQQAMKAMQAAKIHEQSSAGVPGSAFKSAQSARAAQIMRADILECPNCTAGLPHDAQRCGCGYQFSTGENEMPQLSLSPAEQSELLRQVAFETYSKHR